MIKSRSFLLRMRNVLGNRCRKNQSTRSLINFFFLNRAVYETMWKNRVGKATVDSIRRMRIAC